MVTWGRDAGSEEEDEVPDLQIFADGHPNGKKYSGGAPSSSTVPPVHITAPESRWTILKRKSRPSNWELRKIFKEYEKMGLIFLLTVLTIGMSCLLFMVTYESHFTNQEIKALREQIQEFQSFQQTMEQRQEESHTSIEELTAKQSEALEKPQVPVGFIYVQLMGQLAPEFIWPHLNWTDVTFLYAGQFFRALGGFSAPFGTTQDPQAPRLTRVSFADHEIHPNFVNLPVGGPSDFVHSGSYTHDEDHVGLSFTTSGGEVRPYNSAVRIWKRDP